MQGHVDMRTLIVKDYDHPMYPQSLRIVAVLDLPWGTVDLDEIPEKVLEELARTGIGGYEIHDSRSVEVMGAGFNGQHVLLTLASGAAEGAASALIERLVQWCTQKAHKSSSDAQASQSIDRARNLVLDYFNPQGDLETVEISISDEASRFVLQDSLSNRYIVETAKGSPENIVAKRVLDSGES